MDFDLFRVQHWKRKFQGVGPNKVVETFQTPREHQAKEKDVQTTCQRGLNQV